MRKIPFEGPVNRSLAIATINEIEKLDAQNQEDIFLVINGPGGCCYSMLGVVDAMKRARSRVGAIVVGHAMSADCLILAAAEKGLRYAFPNAFIMCHEPRGELDVLNNSSTEMMETIKDLMVKHMKDVLHMSEDEIENFAKRDQHMSASEALELGFIDAIIDGF